MINGVNYAKLFLPWFSPFPRMGLFAGPRKLNTKLSNHLRNERNMQMRLERD